MARPKRENMKRLNFYIPGDLGEWVEHEAEKTGLSMAAVIIMALHSYRKEQVVVDNPSLLEAVLQQLQQQQREAGGITEERP